MDNNNQPRFQWDRVVELLIIMLTVLGSSVGMYIYNDMKIESEIQEMKNSIDVLSKKIHAMEQPKSRR
jgi:hypothetical protein